MNLHQKLVAIRSDIDAFVKDTKGYNYKYVSGTQVLGKIQNKMNELGVLLVPKILEQHHEKHEYVNTKGKPVLDFIVHGAMTYTWINADKPDDTLEVPFYYTGAQDDISKAFGSGLTYSERYFVIKFFNLPTEDDDPDKRNTSGRAAIQHQKQHEQYYNDQKETQKRPNNAKEAGEYKITFGKHEGKTLKTLWKEQPGYISWLLNNTKDEDILHGIALMQEAVAAKQAAEKMNTDGN